MSKQVVTVCLPPCGPDELRPALAAAMAPFEYDAQIGKPDDEWQGEWDHWYIASAGKEFTVRPGAEDEPLILRDGQDDDGPPRPRSLCDGGPKHLLDLDAGRRAAAQEAAALWDAWHAFAGAYAPSLPYAHFVQRTREDPAYSEARALEDFGTQPVIHALGQDPALADRFGFDPPSWFGDDRTAFATRAAADVLPTFALLTLDGRWLDGSSHAHNLRFNAYLDALPPSTILVRALYHS